MSRSPSPTYLSTNAAADARAVSTQRRLDVQAGKVRRLQKQFLVREMEALADAMCAHYLDESPLSKVGARGGMRSPSPRQRSKNASPAPPVALEDEGIKRHVDTLHRSVQDALAGAVPFDLGPSLGPSIPGASTPRVPHAPRYLPVAHRVREAQRPRPTVAPVAVEGGLLSIARFDTDDPLVAATVTTAMDFNSRPTAVRPPIPAHVRRTDPLLATTAKAKRDFPSLPALPRIPGRTFGEAVRERAVLAEATVGPASARRLVERGGWSQRGAVAHTARAAVSRARHLTV